MKDRIVDTEYYIGRLYHPEEDHEKWLYAEVTGQRYKNDDWIDTRRWSTGIKSKRAHRFPAEDYTLSKARAIFKVTKPYKVHKKKGYQLQVIRVQEVRELLQVGENASPLIQLAMLAPDEID